MGDVVPIVRDVETGLPRNAGVGETVAVTAGGTGASTAPGAVAKLGLREITDALTVASDGTLSQLSQTPNGGRFTLNVGGLIFRSTGPSPVFTVSGKTVIWNAANAPNGAALDPSDAVSATYTY